MKSIYRRSLLIAILLMLISSTSFANLRKGRVESGNSKQYELVPSGNGISLLSLIYDAGATDLDLVVGFDDGELLAASISSESFLELLQLGLIANETFLVIVDNFEGPATSFRLVANSGEQETISTAVGRGTLKEVQMNAAGKKLRDSLRKLRSKKK